MGFSGDLVHWRSEYAVWFLSVLLVVCLLNLFRIPAWWRGEWYLRASTRRRRAWLPVVLGLTLLLVPAMAASILGKLDAISQGLRGLMRVFIVLGIALLVIAPFVAFLRVFDFVVPPDLRQNSSKIGLRHTSARKLAEDKSRFEAQSPNGGTSMKNKSGATLLFRRPKRLWRDRMRAYEIHVDGRRVGMLNNGQEVLVDVTPGAHSVRATISSTGSPTIQVSASKGATVTVRVEPAPGSPLDAISTPDGYLRLIVED